MNQESSYPDKGCPSQAMNQPNMNPALQHSNPYMPNVGSASFRHFSEGDSIFPAPAPKPSYHSPHYRSINDPRPFDYAGPRTQNTNPYSDANLYRRPAALDSATWMESFAFPEPCHRREPPPPPRHYYAQRSNPYLATQSERLDYRASLTTPPSPVVPFSTPPRGEYRYAMDDRSMDHRQQRSEYMVHSAPGATEYEGEVRRNPSPPRPPHLPHYPQRFAPPPSNYYSHRTEPESRHVPYAARTPPHLSNYPEQCISSHNYPHRRSQQEPRWW